MEFTFSRDERLKSRKTISRLFREGNSFVAYPLRVVWLPLDDTEEPSLFPAQLAISVPRRAFKSAVARNRLKRRIREAYRLQKNTFYQKLRDADQRIALMLVLLAKEKEDITSSAIEAGIRKMIRKFPG
ncbi:MAG: ribonuclease P protein component [Bacteroidetes bacterium]|nr:MAG: ribonuclease P protein component [Bacteroidota bacterium]